MLDNASIEARHKLRLQLKRQRSALPRAEIERASKQIAKNIWRSRLLSRANKIAVYLAVSGEVDCSWIVKGAKLRKMRIFVPVLSRQKLLFAPLKTGSKFTKNRFGIAEPVTDKREILPARNLDCVIVPLLGFDRNANRIGMGGGYYDRSFAFRAKHRKWRRPLLIGVAYSFQQVASLPTARWDIPMDAVVTEQKLVKNR